jgi:hypothetical protein
MFNSPFFNSAFRIQHFFLTPFVFSLSSVSSVAYDASRVRRSLLRGMGMGIWGAPPTEK